MNIWKILNLFLIFIPDCIQIFLYKIFYLLLAKRKFKNKIYIYSKKNKTSKNNLVILDNMGSALGDFFVLLNVIKNITKQKSDYKYVFVINEIYKELVLKENLKNVDFIFLAYDLGSNYNVKKISEKEICRTLNSISNQIKEYSNDWNNVFICSCWLDLTHYSILSKINYNFAYYLKHFLTSSKPRIVFQNIFIPSMSIWIYFYYFYKKYNLQIWNLKYKNFYFFGKMAYDMIKDKDKNLLEYSTDNKNKNIKIKKLENISIMLKTSHKAKDINEKKFIKFLEKLNLNNDVNLYFLNKQHYDIPNIKNLNVINLTGKTQNLFDLIKCIKKSELVITADTSLYHISSYLNIPTIVFIKSKIFTKRRKKFWLENYKNNLIVENKYFFKKRLINQKKELIQIQNKVKSFLTSVY